ncbi:MAG: hypothetical protein KAT65_27590, partial [Methanophagales archaeon]|nr:hypothetical protein [Methanophagales archaeon]
AVMLVAFEILRKTYSTYAFKSFFQGNHLKEIFVIYISTILVSVLTLVSLSDPLSSRDIDLIFFSLLLFAGSLLILFPYSQQIISSTQSKKRIEDLVERIEGKEIEFFRLQNYLMVTPVLDDGGGDYDVVTPLIEENPIFILSEVAVRALRDDDRIIPRFILAESTKKLLTILKNVENNDKSRETIKVFLSIYKNTANQATKSRQEVILHAILGAFEGIHSFCAENKLPWYVVIELNDTLVEIIEETIKNDLINVSQHGLYTIGRIMKMHLEKNIPYEDEIWIWNDETAQQDPDKDLQWVEVHDKYIRMVSDLAETAIDVKKSEVVSTGLFVLENMASEVMHMDLGDLQKTSIIRWCYYYVKKLVLKCVEDGLYRERTFRPNYFATYDTALEKRAKYSKIPLTTFSDILIELAQRKSLNRLILNDLVIFGRSSIGKIEEDAIYKDSLLFIIRTFNKIKKIVEKDLNEENKQIYIEINKQLNSFRKRMDISKKKDSDVENALNDVINSFSKLDQIKSEYEKDMITWGN